MQLIHTVAPEEEGTTLQQLLRGVMGLSGRQARLAKQKGAVTVDAAPFFSNQPLHAGMVIRVALDGFCAPAPAPAASPAPLRVLYEDEALIAVYKPAPLQCHPSPSAPNGSDTLQGRVCAYLQADAHAVHRLDAETTGIVLFARLAYAQAHLQRQMHEGTFLKTYQAWCFGRPEPAEGTVDAPIARSAPESFTRVVSPDGQRAISRYAVLRTTPLCGTASASLLSLSPVTGRTHQLRVHMAHIGCPILGDTRYHTPASRAAGDALGLTHHQLAAVSLRFIHPLTLNPLVLTCPAQFDVNL